MPSKERTNRSAEAVAEIRRSIEDDYKKNPDLFDENDYKRALSDDWFVKRFLLIQKRNVDCGYKALRDMLVWMKEMNLTTLKDYNFPAEIYSSSLLFPYESDKNGQPVVYLRVSKYRKIPEMENILQKYVIHLFDKMDRFTNGNGIGMIFDLTNASTSSLDWAFLKYFTDTGTKYFPYSIKYVLIYNLPWYLSAIQKVALSWVPKENMGIIKFGKGSQIFDYIDEANLPDFLGGKCSRDYRYIPKGAVKLEDVLKEESVDNEKITEIVSFYTELSAPDSEYIGKIYSYPDKFFDEKMADVVDLESTDNVLENNQTYLIVEPKVLLFSEHRNTDHLSSQLLLRNICDKVIAFKVKSNNPVKYRVTPAYGLIGPKATFSINLFQLIGFEGITRNNKVDKFRIESQPVTSSTMIGSEFYNLWTNPSQLIKFNCVTFNVNKSQPIQKRKSNRVSFKTREEDHIREKTILRKNYASIEIQQNKTSLLFSLTFTFLIIIISYFLAAHSDLKTDRYLRNNATLISSNQ